MKRRTSYPVPDKPLHSPISILTHSVIADLIRNLTILTIQVRTERSS